MKFIFRAAPAALLAAGLAFAQQSTPPPTSSSPPSPPAALPEMPVPQTAPPKIEPTGPTAVFDTSMGRITCKLFEKEAPVAVANFVGLAEGTKDWTDPITKQKVHGKPLYDGTTFHRVIPGFMIQGGDPIGTGTGDPGYYFADEFNPDLNFDVPGRLAMANNGPDTDGSQFFITEAPQEQLDQHYTIFGQCDDPGISVGKAIARVERDANDKPLRPVMLDKVTIVQDGQPMPALPPAAVQAAPPALAPQN
jgi:peptidyl-prolyl cis-trans isomerase A (cyclophilin A)